MAARPGGQAPAPAQPSAAAGRVRRAPGAQRSSAEVAQWVDDGTPATPMVAPPCARPWPPKPRWTVRGRWSTWSMRSTRKSSTWWIHTPDAASRSATTNEDCDLSDRAATARLFGDITAKAQARVGNRFDLMVGLITPDACCWPGLESIEVEFRDPGLTAPSRLRVEPALPGHAPLAAACARPLDAGEQIFTSWRAALRHCSRASRRAAGRTCW